MVALVNHSRKLSEVLEHESSQSLGAAKPNVSSLDNQDRAVANRKAILVYMQHERSRNTGKSNDKIRNRGRWPSDQRFNLTLQ